MLMMMDYALLSALNAVVREGSFERASRALHVTPSAISQRIKLLEERMGTLLVVRGQPCRPTATGALVCRHMDQVHLLEHELENRLPEVFAASPASATNRPTLRIAANADSVATWFVPVLGEFAVKHDVLFELTIDDQDHTAELLRSGMVQAAVTTAATPIQGCRSTRLGRMRFLATCSPAFHRRHFASGLTRGAFANAPCLVFNAKDQLQRTFIRRLLRTEIEVPTHWLPSTHGFVDACIGGMGWALNPEVLVREHLEKATLIEVAPKRDFHLELHWQCWKMSSSTFDGLTRAVVTAARAKLR